MATIYQDENEEVKRVAQAVVDGYRLGYPVVVMDEEEKILFHGRETLQAHISLKMPMTAMTIYTCLSQQEWDDSELPEWCEAARTVFMADQFPQR